MYARGMTTAQAQTMPKSKPTTDNTALLVDRQAAAQILGGVSMSTLERLIRAGDLTPIRLGRRVMLRRSELFELVERLAKQAKPER